MASAGSGDEKAAAAAMITLISSDNEKFEVTEATATLSQTIRHMIEDGCTDGGVPLPNVTSKILARVIEYCKKHATAAAGEEGSSSSFSDAAFLEVDRAFLEELEEFDDAFLEVDRATLFDLILAANYLDIKGLLNLTCQKVADSVKGKTPEQIREMYNIVNDLTPEEEAEIRRETQWAFE
ncbi:unnamed protein product [Urochloa decumbens]|uniref:SKP1-like protein n=1 Tax=Urochloa decumbens TaxID=240449 RepID=A0ABC9FCL0_9POAL